MQPPPSWPNHFLKPLHWGLGLRRMNLGGQGRQTFSIGRRTFNPRQAFKVSLGWGTVKVWHTTAQSTHMPKPDVKGAESVYAPFGGTTGCIILLEEVWVAENESTIHHTRLPLAAPTQFSSWFLLLPPFPGSSRRYWGKFPWRKTTQTARLQQLLFPRSPVLFSSASKHRRQGGLGRRLQMKWKKNERTETFLINPRGHLGSAWGKRQSDLCVHLEDCAWENVIKPTPQSHHPLQLIFTEHPLRHWPCTQNYKLSLRLGKALTNLHIKKHTDRGNPPFSPSQSPWERTSSLLHSCVESQLNIVNKGNFLHSNFPPSSLALFAVWIYCSRIASSKHHPLLTREIKAIKGRELLQFSSPVVRQSSAFTRGVDICWLRLPTLHQGWAHAPNANCSHQRQSGVW